MNSTATDILMHIGVSILDGAPGVGSGRYPRGSGDNPYQHGSGNFVSRVKQMRKDNFSFTDAEGKTYYGDTAIAKSMGISTTEFRAKYALAKNEERAVKVAKAAELRDSGMSYDQIAKEMGYANDSSVRSLLNEATKVNMNQAVTTANYIKEQVDKYGMFDVGEGAELYLGVSKEKLNQALVILEEEGYNTFPSRQPQVTNPNAFTNRTTSKTICPPDTPYKVKPDGTKVSSAVYELDKINSFGDLENKSFDNGETFTKKWVYPESMDSSRLMVRGFEDGGADRDGIIELRRGVEDLSLGNSNYAQVRILVDGKKYLKGMAVYSDDLPDGIDVRFNSNKSNKLSKLDHLKTIKDDPDDPFGSVIKEGIVDPKDPRIKDGGQSYYYDKNGKRKLSLINKHAEEGDWNEWSKELPAQFLSKQNLDLVKKQLNLSITAKEEEFAKINAIQNPTLKKYLLDSFASDCDSTAVELTAASLPRQRYQVILPTPSIKEGEVYAQNYRNGEKVALVRFPHGGTFEIPILKVNNNNVEGQKVIGKHPKDAIGISPNTAKILSGADFDGDTVLVIPINSKVKITNKKPLKGLKDFDPTMMYGPDSSDPVKVITKDGKVYTGKEAAGKKGSEYYTRNGKIYKAMSESYKQNQMGVASNLINDMTIKGAEPNELAMAVRHSMVVIDAVKHKLDYKQSEIDNHIKELKRTYQGHETPSGKYKMGVSTLISRAKSPVRVNVPVGSPKINKKGTKYYDPSKPEGTLLYNRPTQTFVGKDGKVHTKTVGSTRMAETTDAMTLLSDNRSPVEICYGGYANKMKGLANKARLEKTNTGNLKYSPSAKKLYKKEVESLNAQLELSERNKPLERQAQRIAASVVKAKEDAHPELKSPDHKKERSKIAQQALVAARAKVGARRHPITFTDKEWEAVQAGAISENQLNKMLKYADTDSLKNRAIPYNSRSVTDAQASHMKALANSGYSTSEIADKYNVSTTTVLKYIR